jgi:hypothetical protein
VRVKSEGRGPEGGSSVRECQSAEYKGKRGREGVTAPVDASRWLRSQKAIRGTWNHSEGLEIK